MENNTEPWPNTNAQGKEKKRGEVRERTPLKQRSLL